MKAEMMPSPLGLHDEEARLLLRVHTDDISRAMPEAIFRRMVETCAERLADELYPSIKEKILAKVDVDEMATEAYKEVTRQFVRRAAQDVASMLK